MKIYIMTDLEGVAGVLDFDNWCSPEGRYYEVAKEFLTLEVNAAIDGFFEGGAKEIVVADGHGPGGINVKLLDPRVELIRWWPSGWPLLLDKSYDAVAWVGQHAKAGSEYAHLSHTQDSSYLDLSINGISIGELGQFAMCASELGVRSIFASGDEALTREAKELIPGIETVAVKRGTMKGRGDECTKQTYLRHNKSAVHLHPIKARELIRSGALSSVGKVQKEDFGIISLNPPFERVTVFRADIDNPKRISREKHSTSISALLNLPFNPKPEYD